MSRYALYMRREELNAVASAGGVAVVPTGSLEQHGRHLPVGTDSLLSEAVVREGVDRAVEAGTEAVAFPALWTGFSPHHTPLGGTVTLSKETIIALYDDVCQSLLDVGFSKVLLVNGHGGNVPAVSLVAGDVGTRQDRADVAELSYMQLAKERADDIREGDAGSAYHAGEFETALLLYLYDEYVDMDAATDSAEEPLTSYSGRDMFQGGLLGMRRTYDRLTEDGVRGEPSHASAEEGEEIFETVTDELAVLLAEFEAL